MKIVRPSPAATREVECEHCRAVVECARHELAVAWGAGNVERLVLKCPSCGEETSVQPSLFEEPAQ